MQSSQRQEHQEKLDGIFQDDNIMKFLVEKSKTATSGIGLYPLIEEFVQLYGHYHDPETICRRFRDKTVRKIHLLGMSDEDIARVLFVTSISVNKTVLEELKKNALVELDTGRRIIKFATSDGLVKFEGIHQRQVPINTINSPAPADPKKRKVGEVEEQEQKEPPMKKTRGEEEEEMVVKKEVEEEEVEASEVPQNLEELPEVHEEVSQRVEDHVEKVAAPDAPGVEEEPKNAPEEAKEVKVASEENGGAPDAPEAQEMKEEPKKAPELKEAASKAQEVAQDAPKALKAPIATEAPKAAPGVPKMKKTAPEALKAAPKASGAPGPPARKMAAPRLPKETPRMRGFSPAAPNENVAPKDRPNEDPQEKEVKTEVEDDEEYNKAAPKKEFVDYINKLKSSKNRATKNAEQSARNDGEGTSSEKRRSSHSERKDGEGTSSEIRRSSHSERNDGEGTSSEIRRSSRKSLPTWRKAEGSESSEPRGKKVAVAAPAAPKAVESSESHRATRSRTSTDAPNKMEDTPKSVAKTTPVAVKTAKKTQVSSPIIVPKGMEGAPESKKRGPKTPASSKTPKRGPKAREPPQNVRRSARMSEQAEKIASAPSTPAPAKPVVTRHVAFNGSGPLSQGPSAPGAHASGSTVTNKHFLEHTRAFVASIDTPECNKMTKRYDNLIKKMKDEKIDLEKLQKALQSTITILTSKKK